MIVTLTNGEQHHFPITSVIGYRARHIEIERIDIRTLIKMVENGDERLLPTLAQLEARFAPQPFSR